MLVSPLLFFDCSVQLLCASVGVFYLFVFFFFKQKTAYEMRISDGVQTCALPICIPFDVLFGPAYKGIPLAATTAVALAKHHGRDLPWCFNRKIGRASCRERVCQYV